MLLCLSNIVVTIKWLKTMYVVFLYGLVSQPSLDLKIHLSNYKRNILYLLGCWTGHARLQKFLRAAGGGRFCWLGHKFLTILQDQMTWKHYSALLSKKDPLESRLVVPPPRPYCYFSKFLYPGHYFNPPIINFLIFRKKIVTRLTKSSVGIRTD